MQDEHTLTLRQADPTLPPKIEQAAIMRVLANQQAGRLSYASRDPFLRSETVEGVGSVQYSQTPIGSSTAGAAGGMSQPVKDLLEIIASRLALRKKDGVFMQMFRFSLPAFTLLLAPTIADAAFYVAPNGSNNNPGTLPAPFATLGKCQTAMRAGSDKTCYLRAGTYTLPSAGLVLTSLDNNQVWSYHIPDGLSSAIISGASLGANKASITSTAASITITGLKFINNSYIVLDIEGNSSKIISNMIDGGGTNHWYGLYLQGSNFLVNGNTIESLNGSGAYGIQANTLTNSMISNNNIWCNSHYGMQLKSGVTNTVIFGNQILNTGHVGGGTPPNCPTLVDKSGTGIDNESNAGNLFVNNTITGAEGYSIVINGTTGANYISDNTLQTNSDPAITLNGGPSTVIRRNIVSSPGGNGFNLGDEHDTCPRNSTSNNLLVTNNTITSLYEPIYLSATQNSVIQGNTGNIGTVTTSNPSPSYKAGISVINWAADGACAVVANNTGNIIRSNSFTSSSSSAHYGIMFETNQSGNTVQYNVFYPFGSPGSAAIQNNSGASQVLIGNQTTSSNTPLMGAPPVANAGASGVVASGATVNLDGSSTRNMVGANAITFAWTQILGPTVTITNSTPCGGMQQPSFVAPTVTTTTILGFKLIATTSNGSTYDYVYYAVDPFL